MKLLEREGIPQFVSRRSTAVADNDSGCVSPDHTGHRLRYWLQCCVRYDSKLGPKMPAWQQDGKRSRHSQRQMKSTGDDWNLDTGRFGLPMTRTVKPGAPTEYRSWGDKSSRCWIKVHRSEVDFWQGCSGIVVPFCVAPTCNEGSEAVRM